MVISLIMLPGSGQSDVNLPEGSTISDLVRSQNLSGRSIVVNGETVPQSRWDSYVLRSGVEVGAIGTSKGN